MFMATIMSRISLILIYKLYHDCYEVLILDIIFFYKYKNLDNNVVVLKGIEDYETYEMVPLTNT